jgi:hypothetical protein
MNISPFGQGFPVDSKGFYPVFLTFIKDRFYASLEGALSCILLILIEICNLQNACLA